ncbi:hypothetical protein Poli38472_010184 [Pythium oligandrum]|uniref:Arrestin C-terminal-like domain-containing protein n=1 Tax=Pythium oligandrum TaxID=41045 RepID=A0A8K1C992_PYTOL|nr:hypothetical protein Poli38472_010184 [Pythium oligandrum]|eukprot:TMW58625.1 hypothetical protein Poli38472_010184 [Pythium oligandrum]
MQASAIRIELDNPAVEPGRLLSGRVQVSVVSPIHHADLRVKMLCAEEMGWNGVMEATPSARSLVYRHEHFSSELVLLGNGTELQPGTYEYPFRFSVPVHVPVSFIHQRYQTLNMMNAFIADQLSSKIRAKMNHTVAATMVVNGEVETSQEVVHEFVVPSVALKTLPVIVEATHDLRMFELIQRGSSHLTTELVNPAVSPTGTIQVSVRLDNESAQRLHKIKLVLHEDVTANGQAVPHDVLSNETRKVCSGVFKGKTIAEARQGQAAIVQMPIKSTNPTLTELLTPTVHGYFIDVKYRVVIECVFSWKRRISVTLPLTITANPEEIATACDQ